MPYMLIWPLLTVRQAIQLTCIAEFSTIVTTVSAQHADFLKLLGATHIFNCNGNAKTIQQAFPSPIALALDTISVGSTQSLAYKVLTTPAPVPSAHLTLVLPAGPALEEKNAGKKVSIKQVYGCSHAFKNLSVPFWKIVGKWIEESKYVPGGLASVPEALDLSRKGVSGVKLVIHPQE